MVERQSEVGWVAEPDVEQQWAVLNRRPQGRRWLSLLPWVIAGVSVVALAFTVGLALGGDESEGPSAPAVAAADDAEAGTDPGSDENGDGDGSTSGASLFPDPADLPQGEDADRMSIVIETDDENGADGGATATVRADGLLYFEGAFRSEDEADQYVSRAADVFGAENLVLNYSINPDAPAPSAANVALEKPVLFETDSAVIHPDYIPFLEACEGVLKANPDIKMSVAAFTDSVGDEDYNLSLSQRRAQAIIDFYRSRDIAADRLIGTGFGEGIPIADNQTVEGRSQNRRAMLELLDVMSDVEG